jgi:hypothetical protein
MVHILTAVLMSFVFLFYHLGHFLFFSFLFFLAVLGFELRASHLLGTSPFFVMGFFFEIGLVLNLDPPDLCLLSS